MEADLGAVRNLFAEPWGRPAPGLAPGDQAWLLNQAAFMLGALGRLGEAVAPMRVGMDRRVEQEDWNNAARSASNLSELELTLGRVAAAVENAERAVQFADRSGDAFERLSDRTALADALHQAGERERALPLFQEAEAMQEQRQPQTPRLYSLQGFRYAELLLAGAEGGRGGRRAPGRH
ncbi:MAG: Tetratricopeptide repeat-containing protein [Candidatus Kentron sp. G]|nr:MAG: Tetratricopeptide repeat-containing protein [Candidatus Kentron sp. G]